MTTLLTAKQVAERLQVSVGWVMDHASGRYQPVLPCVKLGKSVRFKPEVVEACIERWSNQMDSGVPLQ